MVSYGPWVQEPDYEFVVEWDSNDNSDPLVDFDLKPNTAAKGYREIPGWDSDGARDLLPEALGDAIAEMGDDDYESGLPAVKGTRLSYNIETHGPGFDNPYSFATAYTHSPQWLIIPATPSNNDAGWRPFNYWPGLYAGGDQVWPEGVIGIDWQDKPGPYDPPYETLTPEWVKVMLEPTTQLVGENLDDSNSGIEANAPISGAFSSELAVRLIGSGEMPDTEPAVAYADSDPNAPDYNRASRILGGDPVDLSEYLTAQDGALVLFARTPGYVGQRYPHDVTVIGGNPRWEYGWVVDRLDLRWTLRPPVYRWVYDSIPYRRTFPRDDSLAGGAGRNYPPSRARQTSNRTSGYL